ncbi:tetratricopeptide repeat protein [Pseudalkalibacillus sp. Hm43]|uniref:tetratricopeptide repeat protein n=1 Tax=Pseudalkalibacillus sp. Hm43 TaxID=3450742 RepID=UPI003F424F6A
MTSTFVISTVNYAFEDMISKEGDDQSSPSRKISLYKLFFANLRNQEIDLEGLDTKKIGHITFYYEESEKSSSYINKVLKALDEKEKEYHSLFGDIPEKPVRIIFREQQSFDNETKLEGDNKGFTSGYYTYENHTIHLPLPGKSEELKRFEGTAIHEYTHHLFATSLEEHGLSYSAIPLWFNEGLARYVESKDVGVFVRNFQDLEYPSLESLDTLIEWNNHLKEPYDPYFQSMVFIQHILRNEETEFVQEIIEKTKKNDFENAFQQATGQSVDTYEERVFNQLKKVPDMMVTARKLHYQEDKPKESMEILMKINDFMPNLLDSKILIASLYSEEGDVQSAIRYNERIVELNPHSSPLYQMLSLTLLSEDMDKAIEASKLAVKYAEASESKHARGLLNILESARETIRSGNPFSGYLLILESDYLFMDSEKRNLIKRILEEYPDEDEVGRTKILALRDELDTRN